MAPRFFSLLAALPVAARALDNGVGLRPTLGWNSWNVFACNVNETLMRDTMDAFVSLGLRDAGYVYVGVDDCWVRSPNSHFHSPPPTTRRLPLALA